MANLRAKADFRCSTLEAISLLSNSVSFFLKSTSNNLGSKETDKDKLQT